MDQFSRTELVLGAAAVAHLKTCRVAIFGVGGVGGYAAEALVRSGVGAIDLYDDDRVCLTSTASSSPRAKPSANIKWTRWSSACTISTPTSKFTLIKCFICRIPPIRWI